MLFSFKMLEFPLGWALADRDGNQNLIVNEYDSGREPGLIKYQKADMTKTRLRGWAQADSAAALWHVYQI